MVDLGDYAFEVLASYGVTLALLAAIVLISLRRSRKVRAALDAIETEQGRHG